jgi:hypothetical protein
MLEWGVLTDVIGIVIGIEIIGMIILMGCIWDIPSGTLT